ncbi:hypothetical protein MASR2M12_23440 [Bacteroidales bacterium]
MNVKALPVFLVALTIFLFSGWANAQGTSPKTKDFRKLHYLSEAEMAKPVETGVNFVETPPPPGPVRMVGEFEPQQAVLIRYTFGIPYSLIREMAADIEVVTLVASSSQATTVLNLYNTNNVNTANCSFLIAPSDSYWTRDYGPWFIFDGNNQPGIVDFPYNRPRPNDNNVPPKVAQSMNVNLFGMNVTHTGGNMMADGLGMAASTELVYEENNNAVAQVNAKMLDYLGIARYDVINDPQGEYIKHIDCWGKYLAPDKVLIGRVATNDPRYNDYEAVANYFSSTPSSYGYPYKVYRVYTPGGTQPTPYTNSLILNNKVFVPLTGSQHDAAAIASYQQAMPGYQIVGITYSGWLDTDALHCRTHEIADIGMLFIDHRPIYYGQIVSPDSVEILAKIIAYSGQPLIGDSLNVFYKINNGPYLSIPLHPKSGNQFNAWIKNFGSQNTISYYIAAADQSGRSARHPYMSKLDPHQFVTPVQPVGALTMTPDTVFFIDNVFGQFTMNNISQVPVTIENITESSLFLELVNPPSFPLVLAPGDYWVQDLNLDLIVNRPEAWGYLADSVMIHSSIGIIKLPVMINEDLLTSLNSAQTLDFVVGPNPVAEDVNFHFSLTQNDQVSLTVFDSFGRVVYRIREKLVAGDQQMRWTGTANNGVKLPNGIYFYKLETTNRVFEGKLILKGR